MQRVNGDIDGMIDSLREATIAARGNVQRVIAANRGDAKSAAPRGAQTYAEYVSGQLAYALLRQGRSAEALAICQEGLARPRIDGMGPDVTGGWQHRLAAALNQQRRFDEALTTARASLAELQRSGGGVASGQQMALARNAEMVALLGLERWADADHAYNTYLEQIRRDKAAYDRAYDVRLTALLAAKNNRIDAALQLIDQSYKFRLRLYGAQHPYTVESRGIRGAVELINNAPGAAMADYEDFFAALLDTSSGWVDQEPVGRRGQYTNIALSEFLRFAAMQYQSGGQDGVDRRVFERVVQVTDRLERA